MILIHIHIIIICFGNRLDIRDKVNIRDTQLGLDIINNLRPVDYLLNYHLDYKK
jgi:hypothetical protein